MKAKDLMIDDWVLWKDKPVQIARVSGVVYSFGHSDVTLAHCGNGGLETHDIKSISPIPLTQEILEKNGFTAQRPENHIEIVYCLQDISKAIADEMYALWPETYGFYLVIRRESKDMIRIGIKYVHELQHVLRLCKIDKDIEL